MIKKSLLLTTFMLLALVSLSACGLGRALNSGQNQQPFPTVQPITTPLPGVSAPAPLATAPALPNGTPASSADVNSIQSVIMRANQEQIQAVASQDPSIMQDTATAAYYQQSIQVLNDLLNSGVQQIQLVNLGWGSVVLTDPNTAEATTSEDWRTTVSDGSSMEETDTNVYTLVQENGGWKVQDDQHPDSRVLQGSPGANGAAPSPAAPAAPASSQSPSSNWAGYAATGGSFTSVTGTWVVPNVAPDQDGADATWVGIGGVDTHDLIQAGTEADVQSGQVTYSAWWETLPEASQPVPLNVKAGDTMTVTITQQKGTTWLIVIHDATSNQSWQNTFNYSSSLSSAEWVEESPSAGRRLLLPLDLFGTVTFANATAVENGKTVNIAQANGQPITLEAGRGQPLAQPSALTANGSSFTVTRTDAAAPRQIPGFFQHP